MTCRGCGCTDLEACLVDGVPCSWVEPDLCSACWDEGMTGAKACERCGFERCACVGDLREAPLLFDAYGAPAVLK